MRYRLLGKSGLRVSELVPGDDDLRRGLGLGFVEGREPEGPRRLLRGRAATSSTPPTSTPTAPARRSWASSSRANRDRAVVGDQVHQRHARHRPERRGQPAQEHDAVGRGQLEAAPDRLHRPLLAAHLGQDDADRRGDAGVRRPREAGKDPPRRACRTWPPGRSPGRTRWPSCGAGRRSWACRSSTA